MTPKHQKTIEDIIKKVCKFLELKVKGIKQEKDSLHEDNVIFNIEAEDPAYIIGKHGETLNHMQHLIRLIFRNKSKTDEKIHFSIDINNYRQERRNTIKEIVQKAIKKVIRDEEPVILEPMSASDRKLAHTEISEAKGIVSESIGEEPNRKVVIKPAEVSANDDIFAEEDKKIL